jgi:hypothetical protein
MEHTHAAIDFLAKMVELAGVAIIVGGTLLSSAYFLRDAREGVRFRQLLDRGARRARAAPDLLDALERRWTACAHDHRSMEIGKAPHLPKTQPHRLGAPTRWLERTVPMAMVDRDWQ